MTQVKKNPFLVFAIMRLLVACMTVVLFSLSSMPVVADETTMNLLCEADGSCQGTAPVTALTCNLQRHESQDSTECEDMANEEARICKKAQTWTVKGSYKGTGTPVGYRLWTSCGDAGEVADCDSGTRGDCTSAEEVGGAGEEHKCYFSWDATPGNRPDYSFKCIDPVDPTVFVDALLTDLPV